LIRSKGVRNARGVSIESFCCSIFERHIRHIVHITFFAHKISAKKSDAKGAKKNQERRYAEPLDAIHRL
jgi:hypothetical protein